MATLLDQYTRKVSLPRAGVAGCESRCRPLIVFAVGLLVLIGCGGGGGGGDGSGTDGVPVFSDPPALRRGQLSIDPARLLEDADEAMALGGAFVLELFPDVFVDLSNVSVTSGFTGQTIVANVTAPEAGDAYITVDGAVVSGSVRVGGLIYLLEGPGSGQIAVSEVDSRVYPPDTQPDEPSALSMEGAVTLMTGTIELDTTTVPLAGPARHDLLVVYTAGLGVGGNQANTLATITTAAAQANDAYTRSGIDLQLNVVGALLTSYASSGDTSTDLDRLQATNDGFMDEVHAERDRLGADIVILLSPGFTGSCGKANLAFDNSDADDDSAFSVVDITCIPGGTMTHELGHISGAYHDKAADPVNSPFTPYAHGYVDLGGPWRTIMAQRSGCDAIPGGTCPRINYFSDENNTNAADGRATGTDGLNNVRRLSETAITLGNFRLQGPRVSLYEGNEATQDHVCVMSVTTDRSIDFTDSSDIRFCDNDEARSLTLFDVPAGKVIRLFDSPNGSREDDWTEILVLEDIVEQTIDSFETDIAGRSDLQVISHSNNGLDGKVSRVEIASTPSGPVADFHEGNGGTQNLVCSLPIGQAGSFNFQNDAECDNDEARSLTLRDVPAGTVLTLFDNPDGRRDDDWTEIIVLTPISTLLIGSFERNVLNDPRVRVIYHSDNGLDGKVSRLEVGSDRAGATVDLHEGNDGMQNLVCSKAIGQSRSIDLTRDSECANDEARSLTLYNVPAGTVLALFDNPGGNREDDWTSIEVLRDIDVRTIGSFETDIDDGEVRVLSFRNNGLDGKVSRLEINGSTPQGGILTFHEGNRGTQNKVCDITARVGVYRFKSLSACDNDEARSITLTLIRADTRIEIFDNPDCRTNDDWTEIEVKQNLSRLTVDTFERSMGGALFAVLYHPDNGLDGKVSCVRVSGP